MKKKDKIKHINRLFKSNELIVLFEEDITIEGIGSVLSGIKNKLYTYYIASVKLAIF